MFSKTLDNIMGSAASKIDEFKRTNGNSSANASFVNKCTNCDTTFNSLFKPKRLCIECQQYFCGDCLLKEEAGRRKCNHCNSILTKDLTRDELMQLRLSSLKQVLVNRRISTKSCREKSDLVELIMTNFRSSRYRARQVENDRHTALLLTRAEEGVVDNGESNDIPEAADNVTSQPIPLPYTCETPILDRPPPAYNDVMGPPPPPAPPSPRPSQHDVERMSLASVSPERADGREADASTQVQPTDDSIPDETVQLSQPTATSETAQGDGASPVEPDPTPAEPLPDPTPAFPPHLQNPPSTSSSFSEDGDPTVAQGCSTHFQSPIFIDVLESVEDIKKLTVRQTHHRMQMKEVLQRYGVDYSAVKEKYELIARVEDLWNSHRQQAAKPVPEDLSDSDLCKICMDQLVNCVLLNCGHMVACNGCARKLNECPICRQYVVRVVHVFKV